MESVILTILMDIDSSVQHFITIRTDKRCWNTIS